MYHNCTSNLKNSDIAYWGARQVLLTRMYLADQCFSDRLRVFENSKVKTVLGKFAQKRGDKLVQSVVRAIKTQELILDTDVYIRPNHTLKNDILIGDIDVLVIDQSQKIIYSIECKSMSPSINIKEMVEEIDKLFGSESSPGWIAKHMRRHEWIKINKDKISTKYNLDVSSFDVISVL